MIFPFHGCTDEERRPSLAAVPLKLIEQCGTLAYGSQPTAPSVSTTPVSVGAVAAPTKMPHFLVVFELVAVADHPFATGAGIVTVTPADGAKLL